jgi:hypothetical protein
MAGIFTRPELAKIINDEALDADERINRIMSLRGRDLDDGYVSKSAAKAAQDSAIEQAKSEWEKNIPKPNIKESEEYKALLGQFDAYKTMQNARTSEDFKEVKPKFFETVYSMVQRGDGAKPVKDQLAEIRGNYEEYFTSQPTPKPNFGAPTAGSMPTGDEGATAQFLKAWGLNPKK